jgi:hypothetical protein
LRRPIPDDHNSLQAGPKIPNEFLFRIFPAINRTDEKNPDHWFELAVDSHMDVQQVRAIHYNSKRSEGQANGRDEAGLTNFGAVPWRFWTPKVRAH